MNDILTIGIISFVATLFIVAVIMIIVLRRRIRRERLQFIKLLPVHLVGLPHDKDKEADQTIKKTRDNIVMNWMEKAPFSPNAFFNLSLEVIEDIARIYYPESKDPLKKVSVKAMMDLHRRITSRLLQLLKIFPFNMLGKVELGFINTVKSGAEKVKNHPITKKILENPLTGIIKKIPFLDMRKAVKVARRIKTPMGMVLEAGKEITFEGARRLFLSELIGIVAEESIATFSGRHVRNKKSKIDLLILFTLARIIRTQDRTSVEEYRVFNKYLLRLKGIDSEIKMFLLAFAFKKERSDDSIISDLNYQTNIISRNRQEDDSIRASDTQWVEFCNFSNFSPVAEIDGKKPYLNAIEEYCKTEGFSTSQKQALLDKIRSDLS